jgi:cobalamin biosynthesis protein CobD/CbiB
LFYENAKAASDGIRLLPDSIAKIRDHADELKLPKARRILEDFVSRNGSQRSQK